MSTSKTVELPNKNQTDVTIDTAYLVQLIRDSINAELQERERQRAERRIAKSKTEKIIFVFAVAVSCLMLGYLIGEATDRYFRSPTTLDWSTEELREFPTVSVFLHNIINASKVESMGLRKLHIKYLLSQIRQPQWILTNEDVLEVEGSNITTLGKDINEACKAHNLTRPELLEYVKYDWDALVEAEIAHREYRVNRLELTKSRKVPYTDVIITEARSHLEIAFKKLADETPYIEHDGMAGLSYVIEIGKSDDIHPTAIQIQPGVVNHIILTPEHFSLLNRPNNPCRQSGGLLFDCTNNCWLQDLVCQHDCRWWSEGLEDLDEQKFCRSKYSQEIDDDRCYQSWDLCYQNCTVSLCQYWRYHIHINYITGERTNLTKVLVILSDGWGATNYREIYTISWIDYTSNVAGLVGMLYGGSLITLIRFCGSCFSKPFKEIANRKKYMVRQNQDTDGPDAVTHVVSH